MVPENLQKAAERFAKILQNKDPCLIFCDTDPDGLAGGAIMGRMLKIPVQPIDRDAICFELNRCYVLVDIPLEDRILKKIHGSGAEVLAIDHHPWTKSWKKFVVAGLNPRLLKELEGDPYCWTSCFLAFLVAGAPEKWEWLAALGLAGDSVPNVPDAPKYLVDLVKKHNGEELAKLVGLTENFPEMLDHVLKILLEAEGPEVLRSDQGLTERLKRLEQEIRKYSNPRLAQIYDPEQKIWIVRVNSDIKKLKSVLATRLSRNHPEWVIIAYQLEGNLLNTSFRCTEWRKRGLDLGKIARLLSEKLGGVGGGHPAAAGLKFPAEKEGDFLEILMELLRQRSARD